MGFRVGLLLALCFSVSGFAKSLLVVSGGYQSCPTSKELLKLPHVPTAFKILAGAKTFTDYLKKNDPDLEILWSCYSGLIREGSLAHMAETGTLEFRYGTMPEQRAERTLKFSVMKIGSGAPLTPFFEFVQDYIAKARPDSIYLAGHSYGGWTTLQLGTRLAREGKRVNGVVLLDPISPFQCPANVQFFSTAFFLGIPPGCVIAPRDLLHSDMAALSAASDWRINFYQTKYSRLHSGSLRYPGWMNLEVLFLRKRPLGDTHTALGIDERVWHWTIEHADKF